LSKIDILSATHFTIAQEVLFRPVPKTIENGRVVMLVLRRIEAEFLRFGFDQDNLLLQLLQ